MRIFISYRRDDTEGYAGWLAELLRALPDVGADDVFLDVDAIAPGKNFVQDMLQAVKSADLLLLLVGRRWLRKSIHNADDAVRLELETALDARVPIRVLLLDGAERPTPAALPASLAQLAALPTLTLNEPAFASGAIALVTQLAASLPRRPKESLSHTGRLQVRHLDQGHFSRGSTLKVILDGLHIGNLVTGGHVHRFDVAPGQHRFELARGIVRSNPMTLHVARDAVTAVLVKWNGWMPSIVCERDGVGD